MSCCPVLQVASASSVRLVHRPTPTAFSRGVGRGALCKHQVRFQRRDQLAEVGEFAPEVVLINSHDRSSGYELHAGLFRFICRNGMMVSDAVIAPIHVRHTGQELPRIIEASFKILAQLSLLKQNLSRNRSSSCTGLS